MRSLRELSFVFRDVSIIRLPTFILGPALCDGRLVELLSDWQDPREPGIYAVYPARHNLAPKVRAFVDVMAERITEPPSWEPPLRNGGRV